MNKIANNLATKNTLYIRDKQLNDLNGGCNKIKRKHTCDHFNKN